MINLKNDYNTIGSTEILNELIKYSNDKFIGYGEDTKTKELNALVRNITQKEVDTYVLSGGTITNIIGLSQILKNPYEAVITVETSHINVHETGAIESSGHKIIFTKSIGGKIDPKGIDDTYRKFTDNHMVMPKAVYLSNATELGEVYTLDELKEIYKVAKSLNLYVFIDGARLPQALASSKYTLKDIASVCDMFYLGGTKLGLPYGELLVIVNDELKVNFKYILKNKLGLLSKGFVGAIMFNRFLRDDYYLTLASHSIEMANLLRDNLKELIVYPNTTNQVFIKLDNNKINNISKYIEYEVWESSKDYSIIRLVTAYNTSKEEVMEAIKIIKES